MLKKFKLSDSMLRKPNLNGAVIGFRIGSRKAGDLVEEWRILANQKDFIAPDSSSKLNHRQDQSLLTVLSLVRKFYPKKGSRLAHTDSILTHQDIDEFFVG